MTLRLPILPCLVLAAAAGCQSTGPHIQPAGSTPFSGIFTQTQRSLAAAPAEVRGGEPAEVPLPWPGGTATVRPVGWQEEIQQPAADPAPRNMESMAVPLERPSRGQYVSDLSGGTPPPVDDSVRTVEQCEAVALANNPSLADLRAQLDALQGKWLQAGLRPNPRLGFSGQQLFSGGAAEQVGVFYGQNVIRREKFDWDQQIVCRELEQAQQRLNAQQQRVLTDVRLACFEVLVARRRQALLQELGEIASQNLEAVESLLRAEEGTQIDLLRATMEAQNVQLQQANAENDSTAAWTRLAVLMGTPDLPPGPLEGSTEPDSSDVDYQALRARIGSEHPELLLAIADQDRAAASLQRAEVESLADIDIQTVVQHDNSTNGTNAILQLTFPLPVRNWNQGGIQQARSELTAAAFAAQNTGLGLQRQLAGTWQRYQNARSQVRDYSAPGGILENAKKTLDLISQAHRAGAIGFLDLITAQRTFAQTHLLYIDALAEHGRSRIELDGLLLKDSR